MVELDHFPGSIENGLITKALPEFNVEGAIHFFDSSFALHD